MAFGKTIRHNGKLPLISEAKNKLAGWDYFEQKRLGYDNVTPSPYTNTNHFLIVKYKFSSVSTTNVGIKIPILGYIGSGLDGTPTPTQYSDFQVWNNTTTSVPTWGFNNYLNIYSYPPYPPYYVYRTEWNLSADQNYIYIYTSATKAKGGLNTTDDFWFGFELQGSSGYFRPLVKHYPRAGVVNAQFRPYVSGAFDVVDTYTYLEILDYNA